MYRLAIVGVVALVLSLAGAVGLVRGSDDADPTTTGVAATPGDDLGTADRDEITAYVAALQERLRRLPDDDVAWAGLGLAYVELARVSGNPGLYAQANDAIETSLRLSPDGNAGARTARAALLAAQHDFAGSLAAADQALEANPYAPAALAVRVDALVELGRYDEQMVALRTADRRQPGVPVAARYAYAMELRGRLGRAARILERSVATATPGEQSFLLTLLSDVERRQGRYDRARSHAARALELSPANVTARVALARLLVAERRWGRAVAQWERVVEALPLPEHQVELGELYEHLGRDAEARAQYEIVMVTDRAFADAGVNTDVETALFVADHGTASDAVASASAEWRRRKSVLVADVLAWSLHRSGDSTAALRLAREATRLGTADARLWLHRGLIEARLGRDDDARRHLRRGLATDAGTALLLAASAREALTRLDSRS